MINYDIRPMVEGDINRVFEIENECFVAPWTLENVKSELLDNQFSNFYVLEVNNKIVGFYDYWVTFDSATICQIAVTKEFRRLGLASVMLKEIIDDCYAKRVTNITLEVRTNNEKAFNLYKKYGFCNVLTKKNYYTNGDDAYYMILEVNKNG